MVAKTHAAASVLKGCTIVQFVRKYVRNGSCQGTAFVDEMSQVECSLVAEIYKLLYMDVQVVVIGDFNQLPPCRVGF